jgi:hypothetical protein
MRILRAILFGSLLLGLDAYGRIGESAKESRARYGEDSTLSEIKELYDKTEVSHLLLQQEFKKTQNQKITLNIGDTFVGLGEQPTTYQNQREVSIKTLMEMRDNPPKAFSEFREKNKTDFEKKIFFTKNKKIIQDILGNDVKSLMEFEAFYGEITKYLAFIEQSTPPWFLEYKQLKNSEQQMAKLKEEIRRLEVSLQKVSDGEAGGYQTMTFNKSGFKIYVYLYNDKTYKMIFLAEEMSENDVLAILQNNSDGDSTWESFRPPVPIDETNWIILMEYKTSDNRLKAKFGKYRTDMNDFGTMRGVSIWVTDVPDPYKEKSRAADL